MQDEGIPVNTGIITGSTDFKPSNANRRALAPPLIGKVTRIKPPLNLDPNKWESMNRAERRRYQREHRRPTQEDQDIAFKLAAASAISQLATANSCPAGIQPSS